MAKTKTKHDTTRAAAQDLQKAACKLYSRITETPWGSSQDDDAEIKPRQSGQAGVDVILSPKVKSICAETGFPTACECKNVKTWDMQRAIQQAKTNAKGEDWLLIMKRRAKLKKDRINPVVIMDMKVFMEVIMACLGR